MRRQKEQDIVEELLDSALHPFLLRELIAEALKVLDAPDAARARSVLGSFNFPLP